MMIDKGREALWTLSRNASKTISTRCDGSRTTDLGPLEGQEGETAGHAVAARSL